MRAECASSGEEFLDVPITQREAQVEPYRMLDDHRWKAVATVGYFSHRPSLSSASPPGYPVKLTKPAGPLSHPQQCLQFSGDRVEGIGDASADQLQRGDCSYCNQRSDQRILDCSNRIDKAFRGSREFPRARIRVECARIAWKLYCRIGALVPHIRRPEGSRFDLSTRSERQTADRAVAIERCP